MPLDPRVEELLNSMQAAGAPALESLPVALVREAAIQFFTQLPHPIRRVGSIVNLTVPRRDSPVPIRIYAVQEKLPLPVLVFFHGGGWVMCNLDTHDALCRDLCARGKCIVVSVDYRLAPEHPFPEPLDDCVASVRWVAEHIADYGGDATRMAIGGDSSGGNLAAATALRLRDESGPALMGQLLLCPALTPVTEPTPSVIANAHGYGLTRSQLIWFWAQYLHSTQLIRNPYAFPSLASSLAALPPALVITAEFDPLRDEGASYAERLQLHGVAARHSPYPGMIHNFFLYVGLIDQATTAIDEMTDWLRFLWQRGETTAVS
jgi:acetyl esterase